MLLKPNLTPVAKPAGRKPTQLQLLKCQLIPIQLIRPVQRLHQMVLIHIVTQIIITVQKTVMTQMTGWLEVMRQLMQTGQPVHREHTHIPLMFHPLLPDQRAPEPP